MMYAIVQVKTAYIGFLQNDNSRMYMSCQEKTRVYVLKHYQVKDKDKKLRLKLNRGYQEIK
jgi:hypothetical protein